MNDIDIYFFIIDVGLAAFLSSIPVIFLAGIFTLLCGVFRIKKGTALVLVFIEFVLLAILQFKVSTPYFMDSLDPKHLSTGLCFSSYIISAIFLIILCLFSFSWWASYKIICPYCGAWNNSADGDILHQRSYESWDTVERKIKDNHGNTIGTYEDKELQTHYDTTKSYKCTQCGETFIGYS